MSDERAGWRELVLGAVGLAGMSEHARLYAIISEEERGITERRLAARSQFLRPRSRRGRILGDLLDRGLIRVERNSEGRWWRVYRGAKCPGGDEALNSDFDRTLATIRSAGAAGLTGHNLANRTRFFGGNRARRREVLIALWRAGWIEITEMRTGGVGRPGRVYRAKAHSGNMLQSS